MIPVEPFIKPEPGSREFNAVKKALKETPRVRDRGIVDEMGRFFIVKDQYTVRVFTDLDGQNFIECDCLAGRPPVDDATGLPTREAGPCYHSAAVLLFIAENDKESNDVSRG